MGTVTLTSAPGDQTRVVIELDKRQREPWPAHVHESSCSDAVPDPADILSPVVRRRSETVIDVSLDHFRTGAHAIDVHGPRDELACATLGEAAELPGY